MQNRIYLDHAATTALSGTALEAMMPYLTVSYGNPSAVYASGREGRKAVDTARKQIAALLGCEPREVYFTSCGTESDNWAIMGTALASQEKGRHIVTTAMEHHAVLHTCRYLEKLGWSVTYLQPDSTGLIHPEQVRAAIRPDTVLVSVMAANNEVGTLQPVREIGMLCREACIPFHTDAVQAAGALPLRALAEYADLLSVSAHKFGGPKGVGFLLRRSGVKCDAYLHGGAQERGFRAGTENVAGIVGMAAALAEAQAALSGRAARTAALRDRLEAGLHTIPGLMINGHPTLRLPGHCHFSLPGLSGETLLLRLDLMGIAASSGSACTSGTLEASHVLTAMGLDEAAVNGAVRLTLGHDNTEEEIDETVEALKTIAADLRRIMGQC